MSETIIVGMHAKVTLPVTPEDTAIALASGEVNVLATPKMIALMENAAYMTGNKSIKLP